MQLIISEKRRAECAVAEMRNIPEIVRHRDAGEYFFHQDALPSGAAIYPAKSARVERR